MQEILQAGLEVAKTWASHIPHTIAWGRHVCVVCCMSREKRRRPTVDVSKHSGFLLHYYNYNSYSQAHWPILAIHLGMYSLESTLPFLSSLLTIDTYVPSVLFL